MEISAGVLTRDARGRCQGDDRRAAKKQMDCFSLCLGFPGSLDGKESACNAGDLGLIPGLGISPGEGNGNPFQYSCLEN